MPSVILSALPAGEQLEMRPIAMTTSFAILSPSSSSTVFILEPPQSGTAAIARSVAFAIVCLAPEAFSVVAELTG